MPIDSGTLFVCIKYRGHATRATGGALTHLLRRRTSRRFWYWVFIHVIDRLTNCPGTNGQLDFSTNLSFKRFGVWNGDRLHFDESPLVERFDLENLADGNDFTGFFVGSTTKSGDGAEEADEDKHGISLSGNWFLKISLNASVTAFPIDSPCRSEAVKAACCAATY
jgi:hypothetical protein